MEDVEIYTHPCNELLQKVQYVIQKLAQPSDTEPLIQLIIERHQSWMEDVEIYTHPCSELLQKVQYVIQKLAQPSDTEPLIQPIIERHQSWMEEVEIETPYYVKLSGNIHRYTKLINFTKYEMVKTIDSYNNYPHIVIHETIHYSNGNIDKQLCQLIQKTSDSFQQYKYIDLFIQDAYSFNNHIFVKMVLYNDNMLIMSANIEHDTNLIHIDNTRFTDIDLFYDHIETQFPNKQLVRIDCNDYKYSGNTNELMQMINSAYTKNIGDSMNRLHKSTSNMYIFIKDLDMNSLQHHLNQLIYICDSV
jgi:hypothetical protein